MAELGTVPSTVQLGCEQLASQQNWMLTIRVFSDAGIHWAPSCANVPPHAQVVQVNSSWLWVQLGKHQCQVGQCVRLCKQRIPIAAAIGKEQVGCAVQQESGEVALGRMGWLTASECYDDWQFKHEGWIFPLLVPLAGNSLYFSIQWATWIQVSGRKGRRCGWVELETEAISLGLDILGSNCSVLEAWPGWKETC